MNGFLLTGGILNLYSTLTGECLPGTTEAVAEGNALGRGPVVVEFQQSGIDLIKKQALGKHPHCTNAIIPSICPFFSLS